MNDDDEQAYKHRHLTPIRNPDREAKEFAQFRRLTASELWHGISLEHEEDEQRNQKPRRRRSPTTRLLAALVLPGLHPASGFSCTSLLATFKARSSQQVALA
jgi:hypothetical protein